MNATILRHAERLIPDPAEREAFLSALDQKQPYAPAVIWMGEPAEVFRTRSYDGLPDFVQLLEPGQSPGQTEFHDRGEVYVLDPSSVALASILSVVPQAGRILDLCAAPGGKSIFAWRQFRPSLLVSNEVIGKRQGMLISNLESRSAGPSWVTGLEPRVFAESAPGAFDLVIVDAPCSGQSLAAKGKRMGGAWMPHVLSGCVKRQRRILSDAAECVRPGGWLAYLTCTYTTAENEDLVEWFLKQRSDFCAVQGGGPAEDSKLAAFPCKRIWPHRGPGVGGFACLMQKSGQGDGYDPELPVIRRVDGPGGLDPALGQAAQ